MFIDTRAVRRAARVILLLFLMTTNCFHRIDFIVNINVNMSKVNLDKHIDLAQKQNIKIKERNSKYVPGTLNLQILGSGAPGAPASVYLFTDQSR